ncbi:helix-turn-helix transcriptional regulator [Enterobacteriaceae bacterium H4N4]|uniref:Helix-turn-helix transcriptional regulator n=1 Tax=Silvania confinis TaxID=2926470 RepID=A0A9J6QGB9_9ENTR|nr:helix-turn-helix transcriptional regulator [Silvania confinis]
MKRTRLEESSCPVARSLDIIGDWWSLLIVRDALRGITRFGEFQKSLGIAKNMLATRLKLLVDEGILVLQPASDGSAWQEYVLSEKGRALQTVLVALSQWGNAHLYAEGDVGTVLVDTEHRQPLRKLALIASDGRELQPEEIAPQYPQA